MSSSSSSSDSHDGISAGAPLPDLRAGHIRLDTIAPALGVPSQYAQPDYLEFDQGGRGIVVTMFANTGMSYLLGILGGGAYGLSRGIASTPSSKFKVQLNSVLNHCGRYGSKAGNTLGVLSCIYSLYEGIGDQVRERRRQTQNVYGFGMDENIKISRSTTVLVVSLSIFWLAQWICFSLSSRFGMHRSLALRPCSIFTSILYYE
jgi:hypothetical protein